MEVEDNRFVHCVRNVQGSEVRERRYMKSPTPSRTSPTKQGKTHQGSSQCQETEVETLSR